MYRELPKIYNYETLKYNRKSRSDDPLLSVEEVIENHDRILEEYAREHLGGGIPEENSYKEVGSSETLDSRPEILRLLKAIESPAIKAVLVVEVQRLSRGDLEDAGRLIKIFRYTNTLIITPTKTYDLRDDYDRDAFERELKRGNEYLEYFKTIQRRGKLSSVKRGNYVGSVAPYGFNRVKTKDGKKDCFVLEEKKDEADVVRMIFNWYCNENIGVTAICRRLESMNIKTKTGGSKWKPSIIFAMLENVHYVGEVRWNWRKTVKIIEDQEVKNLRPKAKVDEYLIFEGKHDGIISRELFDKAKEIRGTRHRTKTDTTLKNPFSGIMYCKCGSKMGYNTYAKNGVEYAPPKLVCNNQVHCKTGSVDFHEIVERVCTILEDCRGDFEMRISNKQDDSVKLHENLINSLKQKLKDLEAKELSQWEAQSHPDPAMRMPTPVFQKLNEKLLAEKEEIKQALCKAYESIPKPINYKDMVLRFTDALDALRDPNIPASVKNGYLKGILERIDYERPPIVRITKKNADQYSTTVAKGLKYHAEDYKISIKIKP